MNYLEEISTMKKVHRYHTTKVFRFRVDASGIVAIMLLGIFFVVGMFYSH